MDGRTKDKGIHLWYFGKKFVHAVTVKPATLGVFTLTATDAPHDGLHATPKFFGFNTLRMQLVGYYV